MSDGFCSLYGYFYWWQHGNDLAGIVDENDDTALDKMERAMLKHQRVAVFNIPFKFDDSTGDST